MLDLLRAGASPADAARSAEVSEHALQASKARDAELAAALEGLSRDAQVAARLGDFLTALIRNHGHIADARADVPGTPITKSHLDYWCGRDPAFATAVDAIMLWTTGRPHTVGKRTTISAEQLDVVSELIRGGATIEGAAQAIGVTPITLMNAMARHPTLADDLERMRRLHRGGPTDEMANQLRSLWEQPITQHEIAARLDISRDTARAWAKRLGLPRRSRQRTHS